MQVLGTVIIDIQQRWIIFQGFQELVQDSKTFPGLKWNPQYSKISNRRKQADTILALAYISQNRESFPSPEKTCRVFVSKCSGINATILYIPAPFSVDISNYYY